MLKDKFEGSYVLNSYTGATRWVFTQEELDPTGIYYKKFPTTDIRNISVNDLTTRQFLPLLN